MASAPTEQHAVFLGNLDDSCSKQDVATMISRLILQASGLRVGLSAIRVKRSGPGRCFTASINFSSKADQHRALGALSNITVPPNDLVKDGRKLRVDVYKPKFSLPPPPDKHTHTIDDYFIGQQLGNETRILEFKRGGGDLKKQLKKHLAKYTCAFLNGQGGTLMIGVDDAGLVQGVQCDRQQEDQVRVEIDNIIHQFDPPVLPQLYQVQFAPVRGLDGYISNLKVLEIQVNPSARSDILYETPSGQVFIRRDGSVRGPLKPKEIQEWCRLQFSHNSAANTEDTGLQNQVDQLQERIQKEDFILQNQVAQLQERLQQLETSKHELDSIKSNHDVKRTNSTVCTIL